MSDLDRATEAFRAVQDRRRGDAAHTRDRLLASVVRDRRRQRGMFAAAVVLALVLTNSTTWALSTGRVSEAADELAAWLDAPSSAEPTVAPRARPAPAPSRRAAFPTPASAPERSTARPNAPPNERPNAPPPERAAAPAGSARAAPPAPSRPTPPDQGTEPPLADDLAVALADLEGRASPSEDDSERGAFATAHAVHFGDDGAARSLAAWDAYLARFPHGRFEPEARFNRAVCLLRLGRDDAARRALTPFAEGAYAGIRRRDAARLLEALSNGRLNR